MDQLSLHLLGGFAVDHGGQRVDLPPACQRVIALVALKRKPVHRLWVCATLWPHAQTRRAVASLRSAMWRLRPLGVDGLLTVDPQYLQLGDDVSVDWHDAVDLIEQLLGGGIDPQLVAHLLPLLRAGELLDKWTEPWVNGHRDLYHAMRMSAFDVLGHGADGQAPHGSRKVMRSAHSRARPSPRWDQSRHAED
ncbi:transcriptional regulator [Mycobacterium sp. B14F4]|uniref:AfsR/SARP family transcriptional regulator n=1 Tax=Mycobacterium sp. B14F4 TaxID=3153565 RepID=UPI00325E7DF6